MVAPWQRPDEFGAFSCAAFFDEFCLPAESSNESGRRQDVMMRRQASGTVTLNACICLAKA
jgi:hypothetical protein